MSCNTGAHQACATLSGVGVTPTQTMAAYSLGYVRQDVKQVGMVYEFLPRCPYCKKWVSPRTGVCNYRYCPKNGMQVIEDEGRLGWLPPNATIVRTKRQAARVRGEARYGGYEELAGLPEMGGASMEELETVFEDAMGDMPLDATEEEREEWRRGAGRFLEFASEHGIGMPVGGREMSLQEAYAYSRLGAMVAYPEDVIAEAEAVAEAAFADEEFEEEDELFEDTVDADAPKNMDDYRITDADEIGAGGPKAKYRGNVEAIRLLKQLEEEGRPATPEEQAVLVKYVGWGGLSQAFDVRQTYTWGSGKKDWADEYRELQELLTDEEYESAKATTPNAHYTSPEVIAGMWEGVRRLGFEGGRVLEPACGVGHFYGLMPEDMTERSDRVAVEIDSISARIASHLYPGATVEQTPYQESDLPDGYFDLAISNVPFGNFPVYDPKFDRPGQRFLTESLHNYFFAKAMEQTKPGGVVAFVTSRYTMDGKDSRVREWLASQGDLVGAVRLPNDAFKGNAMTEVTTDILFIRKRAPGEEPSDTAWTQTVEVEMPGPQGRPVTAHVNEYFAENPDMMLGRMEATGSMYGPAQPQLVSDGRDLGEALSEAVQKFPEGVMTTVRERCSLCGAWTANGVCNNERCPSRNPKPVRVLSPRGVKDGAFTRDEEGELYRREGREMVRVEVDGETEERIGRMAEIRDAARNVLELNLSGTEEELAVAREELNRLYDGFVEEYGLLNDRKNARAFGDDPDYPFLAALERYDKESGTAEKADIFFERTIKLYEMPTHADTPFEAISISLNETGDLDWGRMSALTGRDEEGLQQELLEAGRVFEDPEKGFVLTEEYLSGPVKEKLREAEAAARLDPKYQRNVDALRGVIPKDIPYTDIHVTLGSGWVPPEYVEQFAESALGLGYNDVNVKYIPEMAQWVLETGRWFDRYSVANTTTWGTPRVDAIRMLKMALNGKVPTVYDEDEEGNRYINQAETLAAREMQEKMKQRFSEWLWEEDVRRDRCVGIYNERFNDTVVRRYDGSHLVMPGIAAGVELRQHQKDAVWRVVQSEGNTLLAHVVGAGKTWTMIGAGMELRRLGLRQKVMHAVPNHMLEQYGGDFERMYPGARVLLVSSKDLSPQKRAETMSRIATEDWDAVVVTHSALEKLPVHDDTCRDFIRQEIAKLEEYMMQVKSSPGGGGYYGQDEAKARKRTIKEIEKAKKRLEAKLKKLANREAKDRTLSWEELGVDHLFVDEAQAFKNLETPTKMTRVAGVASGEGSNRAFDLFMKVRYLNSRCARCGAFVGDTGICRNCRERTELSHGGATFATGTPITNTVGEMHVMQRFLQYGRMREKGLLHFDAWASTFGSAVTALEMKPTGEGYREFTRFARFNNVPELMTLWREVADLQVDYEALGIDRPELAGGKQNGISVPASPALKEFIRDCAERAERLPFVDPSEDNMLKIVGDARRAGLDMRLVDPDAPDDPDSKVNVCVRNVLDIYRRSTGVVMSGREDEGPQDMAQMIFLDQSTPGSGGFNVYDDIKAKLIEGGIPEEQIAFIHDAKTDAQKLDLFERVNAGEVRVLIGSTEKMGSGTNAQKRLYALHHLDAPWRPADIEQREGRIRRQGNINEEVEIHRYVTEESFDVYSWQTLETKARFIAQVMSDPDSPLRSIDDLDSMVVSYADIKALATGNPLIIDKVKADNELRKLRSLRRAYLTRRADIESEQRIARSQIESAERQLAGWREVSEDLRPPIEDFAITVNGQEYPKSKKKEAGEAYMAAWDEVAGTQRRVVVGEINGYPVHIHGRGHNQAPQAFVEFAPGQLAQVNMGVNGTNNMTRLHRAVNEFVPTTIAELEERVAGNRSRLEELQVELDRPFEHEERFREVSQRVKDLQEEIDNMNAQVMPVGEE